MKYRIQETILKDKKEFRPQFKFLFFWFSFLETYDTLENAEAALKKSKPGAATKANRAWSIEKKTPASSTNNPLRQLNETSGELITNIEKAKKQNLGR